MKVFIGSDHAGFELKEKLKQWLKSKNYDLEDMGAYEFNPKDDYTLYAEKVALMVRDNPHSRGILLCGSGVGVDITANKFDGIRASIGKSPDQVKSGRNDDNMNTLIIAARFTKKKEAEELLKAFLETKFSGKSRYKKRLMKIEQIEANN